MDPRKKFQAIQRWLTKDTEYRYATAGKLQGAQYAGMGNDDTSEIL